VYRVKSKNNLRVGKTTNRKEELRGSKEASKKRPEFIERKKRGVKEQAGEEVGRDAVRWRKEPTTDGGKKAV